MSKFSSSFFLPLSMELRYDGGTFCQGSSESLGRLTQSRWEAGGKNSFWGEQGLGLREKAGRGSSRWPHLTSQDSKVCACAYVPLATSWEPYMWRQAMKSGWGWETGSDMFRHVDTRLKGKAKWQISESRSKLIQQAAILGRKQSDDI